MRRLTASDLPSVGRWPQPPSPSPPTIYDSEPPPQGSAVPVLCRARIDEPSTGQRGRAKIAALLARRPSLIVIDEFASHLDPVTASFVAKRPSRLSKEKGVTLIVAIHRREVLRSLDPDRVLVVAEGRVREYRGAEL